MNGPDAWPILVEACSLVRRVEIERSLPPGRVLPPDTDLAFWFDAQVPVPEREARMQAITGESGSAHPRLDYALLIHSERPPEDPDVAAIEEIYRALEDRGLFELLRGAAACPVARRPRQDAPQQAHLRMHEAGTRVVLAIELHRALNGSYPAALAEIDAAPVPDNPVTGEPFEYERLDDGRYVLRSPEDPGMGGPFVFGE